MYIDEISNNIYHFYQINNLNIFHLLKINQEIVNLNDKVKNDIMILIKFFFVHLYQNI